MKLDVYIDGRDAEHFIDVVEWDNTLDPIFFIVKFGDKTVIGIRKKLIVLFEASPE